MFRRLMRLGLLVLPLLAAAEPARPNLVIMLSDDHSLADSSVYGATDVKTPHMQRLAAAGSRLIGR